MTARYFRHLRQGLPVLGLSLVLICFWAADAGAQGCSMCKTAAQAQPEQGITALGQAILFLLAPPVAIMGTILVYTFRREAFDRDHRGADNRPNADG